MFTAATVQAITEKAIALVIAAAPNPWLAYVLTGLDKVLAGTSFYSFVAQELNSFLATSEKPKE